MVAYAKCIFVGYFVVQLSVCAHEHITYNCETETLISMDM